MKDAIARLIHGFRSFRNIYFSGDAELFDQLKHGQNPRILVIACSDSRVDPALLMQSAPGDLFVIRNVANLVPPCEPDTCHHGVSAALEYAVNALEVEHIIVLGHSDCGGIHALIKRTPETPAGEFLERWLDLAEPARRAVLEKLPDADEMTRRHACEEASLVLALENLLTFPWVRRRVEAGKLALHAWYFVIATGHLFGYDREHCEFRTIDPNLSLKMNKRS
ncbi:carbonic anhydrase [uncultured Victivallis sp.]|uniref:carbonic anhydrase n=1 Tax=uncultured Victivallis sp. TaxID=354118 RepID=UPI0025F94DBB|nr:carbonic anhydrase [uncultured Victivallis sp.]